MHLRLILALATLGSSATLNAQATSDSLTPRVLPGGLSVALPASWRALSESAQSKVNRIVDTVLLNSRDSVLQASLKNGTPMILLQETAPGRPELSVSINAAPSPGTVPTTFDAATPAEVAAALAPICNSMRDVATRMDMRLVSCEPAQVDRAADRTIAVTRLVRTGRQGFVTVWLAQFPDRDVIYTLTLSAPQAEESRYATLFRTIWRTVEISPT